MFVWNTIRPLFSFQWQKTFVPPCKFCLEERENEPLPEAEFIGALKVMLLQASLARDQVGELMLTQCMRTTPWIFYSWLSLWNSMMCCTSQTWNMDREGEKTQEGENFE